MQTATDGAANSRTCVCAGGSSETLRRFDGFAHGRLHSLRHFFVSECFRQGVREERIMEWVGHRDSRIVRMYRHLRPDDGQDAMQRLDLIGNNGAPGVPERKLSM